MPALTSYNQDLVLVKLAANVDSTNTDFDTSLTEALTKAYNWINIILSRNTTVPLTAVPDIIKEIEADIAAGFFKERTTIPVEGERVKKHILRESGEQTLMEYIKTTYEATGSRRPTFFRNTKTQRRLRIDASPAELVDEED